MYEREAERLRRTKWKDANELAEELYAIFSNSTLPLSHNGPVTLNQPATGEPALTLNGPKNGDTIIQINPAPKHPEQPKPPPKEVKIVEDTPQFPGNSESSDSSKVTTQQPNSVFAGTVLSGSGDTYQVQLIGGKKVTAKVPQILASETVPANTGCIVVLTQGAYYFQPPVWL